MRWAGPATGALVVAEIIAFVAVAHATSWLLAVGLTIATGVLGLLSVRGTAIRTIRQARAGRTGEPGLDAADGALALLGSFLLVVPGFVTDAVGVLLLLPPTRVAFRRSLGRRIAQRFVRSRVVTVWPAGRPSRPGRPTRRDEQDGHVVIDGETGPDTTTPRPPDGSGRRGVEDSG